MSIKQSKILSRVMTVLLLLSIIFITRKSVMLVSNFSDADEVSKKAVINKEKEITIVIDAGHGGIDPGKVGINGVFEKDVNLEIALKLESILKSQGINVVMTRRTDNGLYDESDRNKKVCDMKRRLAIIEESSPDLAISIHQNSYPKEEVSGVQVFYYKNSNQSKEAALIMQKQMIKTLNPLKQREAKDNESYYLLKKTSVPILIVECGFLSNSREASLLVTSDYQNKVAWSVYMGIMQYTLKLLE